MYQKMAMRSVAIVMLLAGAAVGAGGAMEFVFFGPAARQFWAGVLATPAGALSMGAGVLLWRRGIGARRFVRAAGLVLLPATVAATAMDVMGPPATLVGLIGSLTPIVWSWRNATGEHKSEATRQP